MQLLITIKTRKDKLVKNSKYYKINDNKTVKRNFNGFTPLKEIKGREPFLTGFTLPELMVVVLIMAVLLSIAIPTFIGARDRAIAREAQSRLNNAVTASKMLRSEEDILFQNQTAAQLQSEASPIVFQLSLGSNPSAGSTVVVIYAQSAAGITFRTRDGNDKIWEAVITASSGAVDYNGPF